jgi:DNA-binding transcriptional regulator GbsR (MarR family)
MNEQDEIIEMAKQAGFKEEAFAFQMHKFTTFAKLVEDKVRQEIIDKNAPVIKQINEHIKELQDAVKAEREACAKVCEDSVEYAGDTLAEAIRARGEA